MAIVSVLLAHGCPTQAIVIAFGLDERTVSSWLQKSGEHCKKVHEHTVQQGKVDIKHVQADEIWVKMVLTKVWMAMAIAVPSRLWLGGAISERRDSRLITTLVEKIRSSAKSLSILVCVDGLSSYVTAFKKVFRTPIHTEPAPDLNRGKVGRPHLEPQQGLLLGQSLPLA
ncbi:DDE-type integrase/transposase/recombinase [Candidatus Magnetobacterium casense]|uniref:DDE-type integrase/transposase/recombinase n=1 Tax=Candidatus Magnetobacterium casense TaxID=1455061 RepID=UPI000590ED16|nr:DDE-type integrase/transposase/recombinase [Candidatus Magnetobacterium casensis]